MSRKQFPYRAWVYRTNPGVWAWSLGVRIRGVYQWYANRATYPTWADAHDEAYQLLRATYQCHTAITKEEPHQTVRPW